MEVDLFSTDVLAHLVQLVEAAPHLRVLSLLLPELHFDGGLGLLKNFVAYGAALRLEKVHVSLLVVGGVPHVRQPDSLWLDVAS